MLYDYVINGKHDCVVTFIDYKAAFDSTLHKCIDAVLIRTGASRKCRAMFRDIYEVTKDMVRVNGTLGEKIFSGIFKIIRGVVQGDMMSPMLFILALDSLIQTHDKAGKGVKCGKNLITCVFDHADDVAMAEERIEVMSMRLTALADASLQQADMKV